MLVSPARKAIPSSVFLLELIRRVRRACSRSAEPTDSRPLPLHHVTRLRRKDRLTERRHRLEWVAQTRLRQPEHALASWLLEEGRLERLKLLGIHVRDLLNGLLELLGEHVGNLLNGLLQLLRDPEEQLLELLELLLLHILLVLQALQLLRQDLEQLNHLLREWRL